MDVDTLCDYVNLAFDAVNRSKVGPFFVDAERKEVHTGARDAFLVVLGRIIPCDVRSDVTVKEPLENWRT